MKIKKLYLFILSVSIPLLVADTGIRADIFYTPSQYNKLKNEKIALELELNDLYKQKVNLENEIKSLKEQYTNDRFNLEKKIQEHKNTIKDLNNKIAKLKKELLEEKKQARNRIKELNATISLLRKKSGNREKELLDRIKDLQKEHEKVIDDLKKLMSNEREKHISELNKLRGDYEKQIAELLGKIKNLNLELNSLKRLTESQQKELNRLSQQTNELEKQLEKEIKEGKIRLKKFHDKLIINIDDKISFDSGSARLKKEILPALKKISRILLKYPENNIRVEGHTDNVPVGPKIPFRDNWHLSSERALAVLNYLLKTTKLNGARFSAVGYGEFHPIVPNNSSENRALNRRVDIVILPRSVK